MPIQLWNTVMTKYLVKQLPTQRCLLAYQIQRNCSSNGNNKLAKKLYLKVLSQYPKVAAGITTVTVVCSGCFLAYEVWSLHGKFRLTYHSTHKVCDRSKFIYPTEPVYLTTDDEDENSTIPGTLGRRVKYRLESLYKKLLPQIGSKSKEPGLLVMLAESSQPDIRLLGLRSITGNNHWQDYQYRNVAQACSHRTIASLARIKDADRRLFLPMPKLAPNPGVTVEEEICTLLEELQKTVTDEAIKQFTARVLPQDPKQDNVDEAGQWYFGESAVRNVYDLSDDKDGHIKTALLQAIAIQSQIPEQCMRFVQLNGLQLLQRMFEEVDRKIDLRLSIARVLGNLCLHTILHKPIIDGGWVGLLHQWLSSNNVALYFHAARALANLDRDKETSINIDAVYEDGVYPAYPSHRSRDKAEKITHDIVFIHGLLGGPFKTWRQEDKLYDEDKLSITNKMRLSRTFFWPKDWLAEDVKHVRIINVGFDTELTTWNLKHPLKQEQRTLSSRSQATIQKLKQADVGSRPVMWVGHSMGGLLIKEMLRLSRSDKQYANMLNKTCGVMFYSVPHQGASLANISTRARYMLFPTSEVQELDSENTGLKELHRCFQDIINTRSLPVLSFGESQKTSIWLQLKLHLVPPQSSDPGIGEFHAVDSNHINVCKPRDKTSELYTLSLAFIKKCTTDNNTSFKHKFDKKEHN